MFWKSSITKVEPNHIMTKGYRQEDLIGNIPFASVFFLLLKGKMPDAKAARMIDAIITASVDHGVTPPSTHASRIVASAGVPLPTAVAAGILAVGDVHGGAIENAAKILQEWTKNMKDEKWNYDTTARNLLSKLKSEGRYMPGFGHRLHTQDPRTGRLFALADELKITGDHIKLTRALEAEFAKTKALPVNVDGAIAAVISDMGFDWRLGKAFFLIGRAAGLIAHVYEEMSREKPMRRMCDAEIEYDGPWERDLPVSPKSQSATLPSCNLADGGPNPKLKPKTRQTKKLYKTKQTRK